MIASAPQIAGRLSVSGFLEAAPPKRALKPGLETPPTRARTIPADPQAPADPIANIPLAQQKPAFSRAWLHALEQSESNTAQRLHNTKGLALPVPKSGPPNRSTDHLSESLFAGLPVPADKTTPLPLVLSFSVVHAPAPGQDTRTPRGGPETSPSARSGAPNKEEDRLTAAPAAPGALAFSAKVKSPEMTDAPQPSASKSESKTISAGMAATGNTTTAPVTRTSTDVAPLVMPSNAASDARAQVLTQSLAITSPSRAESVDSTPEAAPAPTQPMKEIAFQLPGARGVEVRLSERAGEVHIDVRSGDATLTQDLRGNLHDLMAGLERKGFSAEVTHLPEHGPMPAGRSSEAGDSKDPSSGGHGGAFDRQPQQRNRQPGQAPEPSNSKARSSAWNQQANFNFGKEK